MPHRFLKLLLGIYAFIAWQLPAMAQSGSWTSQQFFDQRTRTWWVQVSSTIPRSFLLTVNWDGNRGNDIRVKGSFVLLVPAYPGFGAPVTAQKGVPGLKSFSYRIVPN